MAKMKSVCASGKYSSFCTEFPALAPISHRDQSHQRLRQLITAAERIFPGFQNEVTRRIRYGSARINRITAEMPIPIMAMNCHNFAPARNSIASVVTNSTTTVRGQAAPAVTPPAPESRPLVLKAAQVISHFINLTHQIVREVAEQRQLVNSAG